LRREERGRRGARRSTWRSGGCRDTGQRFEVRYCDGLGTVHTFGYSGTREGAAVFVDAIKQHPVWHSPKVVDRLAESTT